MNSQFSVNDAANILNDKHDFFTPEEKSYAKKFIQDHGTVDQKKIFDKAEPIRTLQDKFLETFG